MNWDDDTQKEQMESVIRQLKELSGIYREAAGRAGISENEFWVWYILVIIEDEVSIPTGYLQDLESAEADGEYDRDESGEERICAPGCGSRNPKPESYPADGGGTAVWGADCQADSGSGAEDAQAAGSGRSQPVLP